MELKRTTEELERPVAERNGQLEAANEALQHEIGERQRVEAELQESKRQLRLITDAAPAAIMYVDREQRYRFANRAVTARRGLNPEAVYGKKVREVVGEQLYEMLRVPLARALTGEAISFEVPVPFEQAGLRVMLVSFAPDMDTDDEVRGLVAVMSDITERKRAEEEVQRLNEGLERRVLERTAQLEAANQELKEDHNLLRTLIDHLPDYIYVKDPQSRFVIANLGMARLTGANTPEELLGKTDMDFYPPELAASYSASEQAIIQSGQPLVNREEPGLDTAGKPKWLLSTKVPLWDSQGKITGIVGISRDITERKRAEEVLREANEKLTHSLAELEQRAREMALLNELGDLLQTCLTAREAYGVIADMMHQLFPGEAGALYMLSASRNLVEAATTWGASPPDERVFAPDDCWALRRGRIHLVETPQSGLLCKHIDVPLPYLCVPMMAQGEALGVLHLTVGQDRPSEALKPFGGVRQRLAQAAADSIALALANLSLRESLRHQSIRDSITGLFNRRYMEETLEREVHRAARSQRPLGVLMLDLDHFKLFNDSFGHGAGDALLLELANVLRAHTRGGDVACRYGGEEFVIILPEAPLEGTQQRAEQLREEMKHFQVQYRGQLLGPITLSLGVATFPEHGATGEAILRAADEALYRAKREGRDRVVVAA